MSIAFVNLTRIATGLARQADAAINHPKFLNGLPEWFKAKKTFTESIPKIVEVEYKKFIPKEIKLNDSVDNVRRMMSKDKDLFAPKVLYVAETANGKKIQTAKDFNALFSLSNQPSWKIQSPHDIEQKRVLDQKFVEALGEKTGISTLKLNTYGQHFFQPSDTVVGRHSQREYTVHGAGLPYVQWNRATPESNRAWAFVASEKARLAALPETIKFTAPALGQTEIVKTTITKLDRTKAGLTVGLTGLTLVAGGVGTVALLNRNKQPSQK
jgi:hypothetical protein